MRKVGIVTYCHCDNYGADLQAYALQQVLRRLNLSGEIIDFDRAPLSFGQKVYKTVRAILRRFNGHVFRGGAEILGLLVSKVMGGAARMSSECQEELRVRRERFENFWSGHLAHTEKLKWTDLPRHLDYKALIAGSDQIWSWLQTSDLSPYFLLFADSTVRKVSYAASVGEGYIPRRYHECYKKGLENLDCISVRERSACKMLQQFTARPIEHVLDPTLLLDKEAWSKIWSNEIRFEEPYIFSYSLNTSSRYMAVVRACSRKLGVRVVNINGSGRKSVGNEIVDVYAAGPREFLYLLAHAQFVITNSFHGTIFAMNFNIPFLSVLNPASGSNSRVLSIVDVMGVSERAIMDDDEDQAQGALEVVMHFDKINANIKKLRQMSFEYLRNALL